MNQLSSDADAFLARVADVQQRIEDTDAEVFRDCPPAGYAIPMLIAVAVARGNNIVDRVPRYSSADHGVNWINAAKIAQRLGASNLKQPYFDVAVTLDPKLKSLLDFEHSRAYGSHLRASVEHGHWQITAAEAGYTARLTPRGWRSALHLLSNKYEYLASPPEVRAILDDLTNGASPNPSRTARLSVLSGMRALDPIRVGVAGAWSKFLKDCGLSETAFVRFQAFSSWIGSSMSGWHTKDELARYFEQFESDLEEPPVDRAEVNTMIEAASVTVDEAVGWGLPAPFLHISSRHVHWPFGFHVLHPNLTLLALLMKRNSQSWDRTVGSHSALVADYLVRALKGETQLQTATRKVKKGVGDLDIAVYNPKTGDLLVCEVKTVFDRFRTSMQVRNFTDQRVDYEKAKKQLRVSAREIGEGRWTLNEIFGGSLPRAPTRVFLVVLTWWDILDPFQGTADSDIAVANFAVFEELLKSAAGDLEAFHTALRQLSALRCPAFLETTMFNTSKGPIEFSWEVQTDVLPPKDFDNRKNLNTIATAATDDLACFPPDWREQVGAGGDTPDRIRF
jgi:hypothetical protein